MITNHAEFADGERLSSLVHRQAALLVPAERLRAAGGGEQEITCFQLRGGGGSKIKNLACRRLSLPAARDGQLAWWECTAGFAAPPWPRRAAYRGDVGWVPRPESLVGVLVGRRYLALADLPQASAQQLGHRIDGKRALQLPLAAGGWAYSHGR